MKLIDIAMYLVYIATYCIVVPVSIGLYRLKQLDKPLQLFLLSLCIDFLLDLLLLLVNLKETNTFLYLYSVADVLVLSWLFSSVMTNRHLRKPVLGLAMLFVLFIGADAFFMSGLTNNGFSNAATRVYLLALAVYFLSELVQASIDADLSKQPLFWISIALVVSNLVGSLDIFSGPIMNYSQTLYLQYYVFWCLTTILMYGAFTYAFWIHERD